MNSMKLSIFIENDEFAKIYHFLFQKVLNCRSFLQKHSNAMKEIH